MPDLLHAVELTLRDLVIGFGVCTVVSFALIGLLVVTRLLVARADRRYVTAVERERERNRMQLRMHERHRAERRSYNARPTASERWDRVSR